MHKIIAYRCDFTRVTRGCLMACAIDPAHHMRRALQPRQPTTPPPPRCDSTRVTRACLIGCDGSGSPHASGAAAKTADDPPRQWLWLWVWLAIDMAMAVHSYGYGNGYGYDNGYGCGYVSG